MRMEKRVTMVALVSYLGSIEVSNIIFLDIQGILLEKIIESLFSQNLCVCS